jgi:4'-phosphopantetheinyl transferase EntD
MDVVEKLRLITVGFDVERVTSSQAKSAIPTLIAAQHEIDYLRDLVRWTYTKLHNQRFSNQDDALRLDEIKLLLEYGA